MTDTTETPTAAPVDDDRARNKAILFAALAAAGIHKVTVEYDGCGDSGQIESIEAWDAGNRKISCPSDTRIQLGSDDPGQTLEAAVETITWNYLHDLYYGWENNDGACGTFVFDVAGRTITLQHNERYTEVNTTSHEF